MEEQIEENGTTFGDVFRTIFSQKWLALILAAAIFVVGTVGLYLYGKFTSSYSVTFVLQLPGASNSPLSYVYPDGKIFYYSDLISSENLNAVKDSDDKYKDINVAGMLRSGSISISRKETAPEEQTITDASYTVSASSKYFKSADLARDFLVDITNIPFNYINSMNIDYDMYITSAKETIMYDIEFDFLENQVNYLKAIYDDYIKSYGANFVVNGSKTLLAYKSNLDVFIQNGTIKNCRTEASTRFYIKNSDSRDKYEIAEKETERQLAIEEQTLNILKGTGNEGGTSSIITTVGEVLNQSKLVEELKQRKQDYHNYATHGIVDDNFTKTVASIENKVEQLTKDFAEVSSAIYVKLTSVSFASANIVELRSGMGIVMSVLLSLILAVAVSLIVAYIVGRTKLKKAEAKAKANASAEEEKSE